MHIDINCDMGEIPAQISDGTQESLMRSITSVNIACGGHAGDEQSMKTTIEQALRWDLTIGAHPGYPDRANFGRHRFDNSPGDLRANIAWTLWVKVEPNHAGTHFSGCSSVFDIRDATNLDLH